MASVLKEESFRAVLKRHGYTQVEQIGCGAFGTAVLVKKGSSKAVMKIIDVQGASDKEMEDALTEGSVLASLQHPCIIRYRESFHEDGFLWIAMDYCSGGTLREHIKALSNHQQFPQHRVLRWFSQSTMALQHIHSRHILHRDLKSENFFVEKNGDLKMGDFGLAKVLDCTAQLVHTKVGTPNYMPPEICQGKPYIWSCDIWSLGVVLFEMCTKRVPFEAPDLRSLVLKIIRDPVPELPLEYSDGLNDLCRRMMDRDPDARPSADRVLKHPEVQQAVQQITDLDKTLGRTTGRTLPSRDSNASRLKLGSAPVPKDALIELLPRPHKAKNAWTDDPSLEEPTPKFRVHEEVYYHSQRHNAWIPATVIKVDPHDHITLDVKPDLPLSPHLQAQKIRPKQPLKDAHPELPAASGLPTGQPPLPGQVARGPERRRTPTPKADASAALGRPMPGKQQQQQHADVSAALGRLPAAKQAFRALARAGPEGLPRPRRPDLGRQGNNGNRDQMMSSHIASSNAGAGFFPSPAAKVLQRAGSSQAIRHGDAEAGRPPDNKRFFGKQAGASNIVGLPRIQSQPGSMKMMSTDGSEMGW